MDAKLAAAFLDPVKLEVNWATIFQSCKAIVKTNWITEETRATIKAWLKGDDTATAIMAVTVIQTISLNCSTVIRSNLASSQWFKRFEKQLARPQSSLLSAALGQLLVDWAFLFSAEELGKRSLALLNTPRHRYLLEVRPSAAVVAAAEEVRLGIPAVAPRRGEDLVRRFLGTPGGGVLDVYEPAAAEGGGAAARGMSYSQASGYHHSQSMGSLQPQASAPSAPTAAMSAGGCSSPPALLRQA